MCKRLKTGEKVLPCPFCGSDFIEDLPIENGWKIRCVVCQASVYEITAYKESAVFKWNKRLLYDDKTPIYGDKS